LQFIYILTATCSDSHIETAKIIKGDITHHHIA